MLNTRQSFSRWVLAAAIAFLFSPACGAESVTAKSSPAFTDVTKESGVAEAITRHYATYPNWWLSGLNLVDLDGDGKLDLFFAAHGAGRSLAVVGDGHGHFTVAEGSYPPSEIHLPYDLNQDGKLDLQMTWQDGGGRWWINESTPGRLSFRESSITAGQARVSAMIDLNRDGKVDWLHERPGVTFEFGDGQGGFKSAGHLEVAATRNEINVHPAELNGDGFMDLAVQWGRYDFEKGRSRVYVNEGQMNFRDATAEAGLFEEGFVIKGIGDVNQDGYLDLLVLENRQPEVYLNDGHGKFTKKAGAISGMETASKPRYVSWGLAVVTDFDNDGVADILWNGRHFLWAMRGTGGGRFSYANKEWGIEDKSAASVDDGLCFGDIDGDGDLDIVGYTGSLDSKRQVRVYRNDLPAQNWIRVRPVGAPGNRGAAGAKIRLTEAGQPQKLLGSEQVMILNSQSAHSYYSSAQTERHFGLGQRTAVDVSVEFYPSGKRVERKAVNANSMLVMSEAEPHTAAAPSRPLREINPPVPSDTNNLWAIVGATLIDGRGGSVVTDSVVVVRGETIAAVGPRKSMTIPASANSFDASGLTLLPGLLDAHFHIERDYELPRLFLAHGVTSVRDPGQWIHIYDPLKDIQAMRRVRRVMLNGRWAAPPDDASGQSGSAPASTR